ncbi:aldehyde dehydrogenase EutE [bacterium]|nr:MAG: aldehyde dehydrogenase EutE [bacterium]
MQDVEIDRIVAEVVRRIREEEKSVSSISDDNLSDRWDIDSLVKRSKIAQERFRELGLEARKRAIRAMRCAIIEHADELGKMAVSETSLGKMPDKREKILLAVNKTPGVEDISTRTFSGDNGLAIEEPAPYGVVLSITPSTNPPSTIVNNSISNIAAGNSIIFQPHPSAKNVSRKTADILRDAVASENIPADVILCVPEPTLDTAKELLHHPGVDLVVVTGGMGVVNAAMNCGKKAICAGPGNPPVVVDETADIENAAKYIVAGASFDNGILCTAEKEVFVVESVADELIRQMQSAGAFLLSPPDAEKIVKMVIESDPEGKGERHPVVNKKFVGKNASEIAKSAGIDVGDAPLLFFETVWDNAMVMAEQLMPVLPVVRVPNVDEAIRLAVLVEHKFRHTFIMHSKNIENLSKMAKLCNGNIFVKNGPSFAGLGYNGEGHTTLTIAGTTGEGLTSARSFTRPRRCTLVDYFRIV